MNAPPKRFYEQVLDLGKSCAVSITGDPEDAETVKSVWDALRAIKAELKLGQDANNRLKARQSLEKPTPSGEFYGKDYINAEPERIVAFTLSEILNDYAPIGWTRYLGLAECLLANFEMKEKEAKKCPPKL